MITGDHAVTAAAIAQNLGITGRAITGAEFAAMSDDELLGQIDDIGVIARVTPEDKVRLVDTLKRKGQIVAMTGDGVNDAPALKRADIGIAMGITGTEVSKEAAAMILTDDNFATIVRAVELGRGLYDNLTKYIRFQMGALFGLVFTFLGAAIGNIVGGVAFVPLQTLWLNFTTQVFQAVGLGYGEPAEGLMKRKPRDPEAQILPRSKLLWLALVGAVMAAATLGVLAWADGHYTREIARTMGMTSFSIANLFYSFCERDERESVFSLDVLRDRKFLMFSGMSVLAIILAPQLNLLNRILQTTPLTLHQWLICIVAAFATVALTEIRKFMLRRNETSAPQPPVGEPEPAVG
jgi:Ca2+-transporting ATPase